jgi:hypothetical protein
MMEAFLPEVVAPIALVVFWFRLLRFLNPE